MADICISRPYSFGKSQSELKDKEHEIELIKLGHEKELSVLKEKLNSIEIEKNHLEETLTKERETTKNQLETLGKVDAFKTSALPPIALLNLQ